MAPRRPFRTLLKFDLRCALTSARGLLFLTTVVVVWGWMLSKLASGFAEHARDPEIGAAAAFLLDGSTLRLLQDRPMTLAVFFVIAMALTPLLSVIGACDQTAGDLSTKHLRFIIPRVGRDEIFFARFTGAAILVAAAQLAATIGATIVQLTVGHYAVAEVIGFGAHIALVLVIYSIAFVALTAIACAGLASIGLTLVCVLGGYGLIIAVATFLSMSVPAAAYVGYLVPAGVKHALLQPELTSSLLALGEVVAYAVAYLVIGRFVFRTRDA